MELFNETTSSIKPLNTEVMKFVRTRFDDLYTGTGNLGNLEEIVVKFAGISENEFPEISECILVQIGERGDFNSELSELEKKSAKLLNACLLNFKKSGKNNFNIIETVEEGINFIDENIHEKGCAVIPSIAMNYENKISAFCIAAMLCKKGKSDIFDNIEYLLQDISGLSIEDVKQALEESTVNTNEMSDLFKKTGTYDIWFTLGIMLGTMKKHGIIILSGWVSLLCACLAKQLSADFSEYFLSSQISSLNIHNELSKKLSVEGNINCGKNENDIFAAVLQKNMLEIAIKIYIESITKEEAGVKG